MNFLRRLYRHLFGYRYYGVLIDDGHRSYISSNIFPARCDAAAYSRELRRDCMSLHPAGIVCFRTKQKIMLNQ